ncbi:MAG TPA: ATP-binding protein [Egibacteraceae bacterium]|nr:ATP-binding protein [Egibacteraceae bacterium]
MTFAKSRPDPKRPAPERLAIDLASLGRLMGEHLPHAAAATRGEEHVLRWVNPAFCQLAGAPAEQLLCRPFVDVLPAARTDGAAELLDRVLRTAWDASSADQRQIATQIGFPSRAYSVAPLFDAEGRPDGLLVRVDDTTDAMLARERAAGDELRDANQQLLLAGLRAEDQRDEAAGEVTHLSALLESLHDAVTVVDQAGRVVLLNPAARALYGIAERRLDDASRIIAELDWRRLDGTPLPPDERPIARAVRGERFSEVELVLVRPDGARLRVLSSGSAIRGDRHVLLAITVLRDVTALRELEQTKAEYLALISHDLRTPLTAVDAEAQLLARMLTGEGEAGSAHAKRALAIVASARRMNAMIHELMESSRLESGSMTLRRQPVELLGRVGEIAARLDAERVRPRPHSWAGTVSADPERVERALTNFVTNALKYSAPGTPVVVGVEQHGNEVVVSVADQGVGIPPDELPRVFERFTRGRSAQEADSAGLGLGLYITRLIVEAHGGRVWVESEVGKGTTFSFALPTGAIARG